MLYIPQYSDRKVFILWRESELLGKRVFLHRSELAGEEQFPFENPRGFEE